ncbi:MAG: Fe(3+) ABC transporter substrate-binding protein [Inquilinus sp.]|nr:Fe(3+) ABC transporter substrate-binding protein [Inquilinus sp.]
MSRLSRSLRSSGAALAAACLLALASGGASAQEVNVYSARHYDTDLALYDDFTAQTGIEVNLIEGSADELIERIAAEGRNSPADVLITVDAGRLWRADQANLFQPVRSAVLEARIPAHLRHPDGHWFGLSKRARVIFYDRAEGPPAGLDSYEDLADPGFAGTVCIRSSSNIYNQSLMASIIAAHGEAAAEAWATGVVDHFARGPAGNDRAQIKSVVAGECTVAVANTYYWGQMIASDDATEHGAAARVGILFPNQDGRGAHVNISGGGVIATAPNRDGAIRFLEYLTGPDAQALFAEAANEYPIDPSVPLSGPIAEWGAFKEDTVNASLLGSNNPAAVRIFDRAGWR